MSRKKKAVDLAEVEKLASDFCTQEEVASRLGVSERTIRGRADIRAAFERGKQGAFVSLRRAQWALAQEGNAAMLIWLGKQYLDQMEPADRARIGIERFKLGDLSKELEALHEYRIKLDKCLDRLTDEQLRDLENQTK